MVKKQNKKQKARISPNMIAVIGSIITMIGGFFLSYNYIQSKKVIAYDYMSNVFYSQNDNQEIIQQDEQQQQEKAKVEEDTSEVTNDYIGYLAIPKINLNKGFVDKRSTENDVEKNILIIEGSSYPDVDKGNLIIAGHSGTGWKAFFNDLYKLATGDVAEVIYKNKKYVYQIVNIYKQPKVGKIAIYRNYDKTTLTLVTCTNDDDTTQTIYIAELQETIEQ